MDSKKVIEKLIKIAEQQQKVIQKLVQAQAEPIPTSLAPDAIHQNITQDDAAVILAALPPQVKAAIANLAVQGSTVNVKFQPNKGTDQVFNAIVSTIGQLQQGRKLRNSTSQYQVKEVA
jgi:hypothetical protein